MQKEKKEGTLNEKKDEETDVYRIVKNELKKRKQREQDEELKCTENEWKIQNGTKDCKVI